MANKPKSTKPAPEVADTSTTGQAAAVQAAKGAADQAPSETAVRGAVVVSPEHVRMVGGCLASLVNDGYPVVTREEVPGAWRAMVPALGPMATGVAALTEGGALQELEEAVPHMIADLREQTGQDMPAKPLDGCVAGELTLEQYLAQPANEWAPYWGPKPEKTQAEVGQNAEEAEAWFLQDEAVIRVYLAARGDKTQRAHQERRPGWLARARRKRDGKEEFIHVELIQNPDAPMADQAAMARTASERGALNSQVTSWQRECKDLMDDIVNRLKTVSGDEEVRAELFEALQNGEEWEGRQPKDAEVRIRCLEHLKTIDTREGQIAKAEARLKEIEATLEEQRQEAQMVLDLKLPATGELILHVNK